MKCPYCAEEVKDGAIFCRYCAHVLQLQSPTDFIQENLSLLEERITSLEKTVASSHRAKELEPHPFKGATAPDAHAQERCAAVHEWPVHAIVAGFLSALASILTFEIALDANSVGLSHLFMGFLLLSTLCPFPFGVLAGIVWGGTHTRAYIIIGLCAGVISLAGHAVFVGTDPDIVPGSDWLLLATLFPLGATLLFLAGGLIGDRLVDRINKRITIGLFEEDLSYLRGITDPDISHKERFELLKALGPACLTLIGTLANSALVFVAAWYSLT